ncbi:hypothetical protein AB6A40_001280 [Gnathostoma spinigerum]|uniref:Uncharacterized protein n=1 Tax=Gnathostoma spinigerum TaxID=75299 RepID=A0ABD6E531_9BILA
MVSAYLTRGYQSKGVRQLRECRIGGTTISDPWYVLVLPPPFFHARVHTHTYAQISPKGTTVGQLRKRMNTYTYNDKILLSEIDVNLLYHIHLPEGLSEELFKIGVSRLRLRLVALLTHTAVS